VRVGVYPGTFDPLTIAHLAVADAAVAQLALDRLVLALSLDPIGKSAADPRALAQRLEAIRARGGADRPWLEVATTEARLVGDICLGYDVCVLGADKWEQVLDPVHYPSTAAHDAALAALPTIAVAPRAGSTVSPPPGVVELVVLDVPVHVGPVSSSGVRAGRTEWLA